MHLSEPWLILVNPQAGNGNVKALWHKIKPSLVDLLEDPKIVYSESVTQAYQAVEQALQAGIRHILCVGGDGSAHHTINAIFKQTSVPSSDIIFALLPLGSGNDWIKTHQIPKDFEAWLSLFKAGNIHQQSIGQIDYQLNNERKRAYFLNVAGLAYDAFVVRATVGKQMKLPPKLYYLWMSLKCLFQYKTQTALLAFNDHQIQQRFYTINVGIGRYSGGGMQFVPHAIPNSDTLAITYVGHLSKLGVIFNSYRFYEGYIASFEKARLDRSAAIEVSAAVNDPIGIEADGEFLGYSPIKIKLLPQVLNFIGK